MNELGLQLGTVLPWFIVTPQQQYTRVSVTPAQVATWAVVLRDAFRRAYISDQLLTERAAATQSTRATILAAKLPAAGAVMSGDFGEIVGYIYLASRAQGAIPIGPKRWRLKQDRTKPAPGSDVVQFILPEWPGASTADRLVCAEVKAKATASTFRPMAKAIEGSQLDSTSRLTRTLVWLRERALLDDIGAVTSAQLGRFINATEFPAYAREFHAIAVICTSLVEIELATHVPANIPANCALVVISVPDLRNTYTTVYQAVRESVGGNAPNLGGIT